MEDDDTEPTTTIANIPTTTTEVDITTTLSNSPNNTMDEDDPVEDQCTDIDNELAQPGEMPIILTDDRPSLTIQSEGTHT